MSLTIVFLLLFMITLLVTGWKNRYFVLFSYLAGAMTLSLSVLTAEVARVSNYLVPANYLIRSVETHLYTFIYTILRIPLSSLMLIRNVGVVAYFAGIVFFVISFSDNVRQEEAKPRFRGLRLAVLIGLPLLFFLFYHPYTAYRVFRYAHSAPKNRMQMVSMLVYTADLLIRLGVLAYLLWPVFLLTFYYFKGRMTILSNYLLRLAAPLLLLNVSFFILFFTGDFKASCADALQYGFWRFSLPIHVPVFFTTFLPEISLILLVAMFVVLMRLHGMYVSGFFKEREIRKNLDALYANVRNVMHSEKNLLFNIRILAEDALGNPKVREESLRKIIGLCGQNLDDLTNTLNNAHDMSVSTMRNDLIRAVDAALANQNIPDTVRIVRNFPEGGVQLSFDLYHMTHAISNVLSNSLEAIAAKKPEFPEIRLTVYQSRGWVYFSVWDNGCGIPPKLLRRVEQPYVSTKNKKNSWGIGLSYVYRVIRAHYGQMQIRSRQQEFTEVEILLPRSRNGGKR